MRAYEPDRVVRLLSGLATGLYFLMWLVAVVGLLLIPAGKLLDRDRAQPRFFLSAPVTVHPQPEVAGWRIQGAQVTVSQLRGTASVPVASASTGFLVLAWLAAAVLAAVALLFLYHLRRLFQRVRQGAPFDPGNAGRLRWLGLLLIAGALWKGVTDTWLGLVVTGMLEGPGNRLGVGIDLNVPLIFVALVLIALAEIFRRGAALEDEQALVV